MITPTRRTALTSSLAGILALAFARLTPAHAAGIAELKFELYRNSKGEYRWRLKSANGRILASASEGYSSKSGCKDSIERIRQGAATATIVELEG